MRILHVTPRYPPAKGGTENHVRAVATGLAARGHAVEVVTSSEGADEGVSVDGGVKVTRFHARRFRGDYLAPPWLPMKDLPAFLARSEADVFHAHAYRFAAMDEAARVKGKRGLVVTAHGFYPPENPLVAASRFIYDRATGARTLRAADVAIAVTPHEVDHYARLGVALDRVRVVPNGIPASDLADVRPQAAAKAALGVKGDLVLFLGRLGHDKGLTTLLRAARRIVDRRPGATVAVVGPDAGFRRTVERLGRVLHLGTNLRVEGPTEDPGAWYNACDVFVLPSRYEAFGIVLLEAMARRKPVVASAVGGVPHVVDDARTGRLVPYGDTEALARETLAYLDAPDLATRHGEAGRRLVAERYTWPRVVDALEKVYADAAKR